MLRFVPSLTGLLLFGVMAWLCIHHFNIYFWLLTEAGMEPWTYPFIDSGFMYAMKQCWQHGIDVYKAVPCDIIPTNRMAYSPLWQRLPLLPNSQAARIPVGVATDLLWIFSLALLPPAGTRRDATLLALAVPSTMVCFALERNNIDVWIYLLAAAGILLAIRPAGRWAGYAIFLFAGLLKYYPFILFGLALREKPRIFVAIAAAAAAALAIFCLTFRHELAEAMPNIPVGSPFADFFGLNNIPLIFAACLRRVTGLSARTAAPIAVILRLGLTVLLCRFALTLAEKPALAAGFRALSRAEQTWLVAGALIICGCYVFGQSVGYRGIYLLIVLSGLLTLRRHISDPRLRRTIAYTAISIVPLMWNGALLFWIDPTYIDAAYGIDLADAIPGPAYFVVCLAREFVWLNLARILLAILITFAKATPVFQGVANAQGGRHPMPGKPQ